MKNRVLLMVIFGVAVLLSSCLYTGPQENCVFIGERTNLHKEYYITVLDVLDYDSIEVIRTKGEDNKSELIYNDKNFVGVKLSIEHQKLSNPSENHTLDLNDFCIKDHTGVQMGNVNVFSRENGLALETKDFGTRKPVEDYDWLGSSIEAGETREFIVFFEFSKKYSVENTLMVLETDFYTGISNSKRGTDIVLGYRKEN